MCHRTPLKQWGKAKLLSPKATGPQPPTSPDHAGTTPRGQFLSVSALSERKSCHCPAGPTPLPCSVKDKVSGGCFLQRKIHWGHFPGSKPWKAAPCPCGKRQEADREQLTSSSCGLSSFLWPGCCGHNKSPQSLSHPSLGSSCPEQPPEPESWGNKCNPSFQSSIQD